MRPGKPFAARAPSPHRAKRARANRTSPRVRAYAAARAKDAWRAHGSPATARSGSLHLRRGAGRPKAWRGSRRRRPARSTADRARPGGQQDHCRSDAGSRMRLKSATPSAPDSCRLEFSPGTTSASRARARQAFLRVARLRRRCRAQSTPRTPSRSSVVVVMITTACIFVVIRPRASAGDARARTHDRARRHAEPQVRAPTQVSTGAWAARVRAERLVERDGQRDAYDDASRGDITSRDNR